MYQIPEIFKDFISIECDRLAFIQAFLKASNIDFAVLDMEGKNHVYVKFPHNQYNPQFKIKTVIAHYDRVEGTPGANDNSVAVFCMLEWAVHLKEMKTPHNVRLIFTDGEEDGTSGVSSQGAFPLAKLFKKLNLLNDQIFVFDCMGRGDVPVLCQNDILPSASAKFKKDFSELEKIAQGFLQVGESKSWFCLPCLYSDNASFIANGIPSVAITMLPSDEIVEYVNAQIKPRTWKLIHTLDDNFESLNPKAFEITAQILSNLTRSRTLIE